MSLVQKVKKLRETIESEEVQKDAALRRAYELAQKFHYIKPKSEMASPERYKGMPESKKKRRRQPDGGGSGG